MEEQDSRPTIEVQDAELHALADQALAAIALANDPPTVFVRGPDLARVEQSEEGVRLVRHDRDSLRDLMSRTARWRRTGPKTASVVFPPRELPGAVLSWGEGRYADFGIPRVDRVATAPFFVPGPGGVWEGGAELVTEPGYHPGPRVYYDPDPALAGMRPVSGGADDLAEAKGLIDAVLGDFPFVGEGSRAHAWALLLLPFVRDLVSGDTPLHLVTAPTHGTGKGLLVDALLTPALGRTPRSVAAGSEDEWRKRITSQLLKGPSVVFVDNVPPDPGLNSPTMAAVLTCEGLWEDRILGKSEVVTLPVRNLWVATGNNVAVSEENARRVCRIHLDRGVEDPAVETPAFRIPKLHAFVTEHRADLAWSALTLAQAWLEADHPDAYDSYANEFKPLQGTALKQSYLEWSRVVGGVLRHAGVEGFLQDAGLQDTDERSELAGFLRAWRGQVPTPAHLDDVASAVGQLGSEMGSALPTELVGLRPEELKRKLRYWARGHRNRVAGGLRLEKVTEDPPRWAVVDAGGAPDPA